MTRVTPYSHACLVREVARATGNASRDVRHRALPHLDAIDKHLRGLRVASVVVESPYRDRDFLEDYAAYYVRCLDKYRSSCTRLHFFRSRFDDESLRARLSTRAGLERLGYLGFMVIKPLPSTFIGRTCLPPPRRRRAHFVTRPYVAHLLGCDLRVESLAFQEQDHATAACATSALWSALHATSRLFDHPTASPVEITRQATEQVALTRRFPNGGLTVLQMATAVRRAGLEPEVVGITSREYLQALVHAYVSAGVPLPLMCRMFVLPERQRLRHHDGSEAWHAVTICGFDADTPVVTQLTGMRLRCRGMGRMFVHDDQVGPFAPMTFVAIDRARVPDAIQPCPQVFLSSAWPAPVGCRVVFSADMLLLPLYHKIRIDFPTLLQRVQTIDRELEQIRLGDNGRPGLPERLSWDVRLVKESALKAHIRQARHIDAGRRHAFLQTALPRFVWSATAYHRDQPVLEYLFDATDLDQGSFDLGAIEHSPRLKVALIGA